MRGASWITSIISTVLPNPSQACLPTHRQRSLFTVPDVAKSSPRPPHLQASLFAVGVGPASPSPRPRDRKANPSPTPRPHHDRPHMRRPPWQQDRPPQRSALPRRLRPDSMSARPPREAPWLPVRHCRRHPAHGSGRRRAAQQRGPFWLSSRSWVSCSSGAPRSHDLCSERPVPRPACCREQSLFPRFGSSAKPRSMPSSRRHPRTTPPVKMSTNRWRTTRGGR